MVKEAISGISIRSNIKDTESKTSTTNEVVAILEDIIPDRQWAAVTKILGVVCINSIKAVILAGAWAVATDTN